MKLQIAIFAGVSEIMSTVSLNYLSDGTKNIFIWFIIIFPSLLVILFFITLNFNPKVLYAPSDFRDDKIFLNSISGSFNTASDNKIEVNSTNVSEIKEDLNKGKLKPFSEQQLASEEGKLISNTNLFFKSITNKLSDSIEKSKIYSYGYMMESAEYYIFDLNINKKHIKYSIRTGHFSIIIHIRKHNNGVLFEAIGKNIISDNYEDFTESFYKYIVSIIEIQTRIVESNVTEM